MCEKCVSLWGGGGGLCVCLRNCVSTRLVCSGSPHDWIIIHEDDVSTKSDVIVTHIGQLMKSCFLEQETRVRLGTNQIRPSCPFSISCNAFYLHCQE